MYTDSFVLIGLFVLPLLIMRPLVIALIYARQTGVKFAILAGLMGMSPRRLTLMLIFSVGLTPTRRLWLRKKIGIPRTAFHIPLWFLCKKPLALLSSFLWLTGFSRWIGYRSRVRELSKEEKEIRRYLQRYRLHPLPEDIWVLLQFRLDKIRKEKKVAYEEYCFSRDQLVKTADSEKVSKKC